MPEEDTTLETERLQVRILGEFLDERPEPHQPDAVLLEQGLGIVYGGCRRSQSLQSCEQLIGLSLF